MKRLSLLRNSLLVLSISTISLPCITAIAGKPASGGPKQYIFSRSTRQTACRAIGIKGVPAYVNFPDGSQRRGVYVTATEAGGAWRSAGLRPGNVLLTVDNRVAESCSSLDSMLGSKNGNVEVTFVRLANGLPQTVRASASISGGGGSALGMAPGGTSYSTELSTGKLDYTETPISQLESHMFNLINKDRQTNGKPSISENSRLSELARNWAQWLVSHGAFSHTADGRDPLGRAKAAGIGGGIAENLAFQPRGMSPEKELVSKAQAVFMAEPPNQHNHRYNILWDEAKSVGVGIARVKGQLMMVQEFSDGNP